MLVQIPAPFGDFVAHLRDTIFDRHGCFLSIHSTGRRLPASAPNGQATLRHRATAPVGSSAERSAKPAFVRSAPRGYGARAGLRSEQPPTTISYNRGAGPRTPRRETQTRRCARDTSLRPCAKYAPRPPYH